jgi:hypothetical protein
LENLCDLHVVRARCALPDFPLKCGLGKGLFCAACASLVFMTKEKETKSSNPLFLRARSQEQDKKASRGFPNSLIELWRLIQLCVDKIMTR